MHRMYRLLAAVTLCAFFSPAGMAQKTETPPVDAGVPTDIKNPTDQLEPSEERQPKPLLDPAVAPEPLPPTNPVKDTIDKAGSILAQTRQWRVDRRYSAIGTFSFFDLIIPSKLGLTAAYNRDVDQTYEFEYMRGSATVPFVIKDLGGITDQRFTLLKRSYFGNNSFNLIYGLSYMKFDIQLGNAIMSRVTSGASNIDVIAVESWGFHLGIGNRWIFNERFVFGVDWLTWTQPVYVSHRSGAFLDYATNNNDYENVDTAIRVASYFPRFAALKLQFGMSF